MKKQGDYQERARQRTRASLDIQSDPYPAAQLGDAFEGPLPAADDSPVNPAALPSNPSEAPWPEPPGSEAFHGLAGDIVRVLEPQSEADPVAILIQLLAAFGSIVGRTAHWRVEGAEHYLNLFAVLVGETAKGRKGTSWARVRWLTVQADNAWADNRVVSGLSSGEGLIWAVRDPIIGREKVKSKGRVTAIQEYEADPGEPDKRLLVQEPEFAVVLRQIERQGNTLSAILRQAWESGKLRTLTKNTPAKATDAHISIIGHITSDELRRYLSDTECASGFGNRFLWLCVRRSKCLPEGGNLVDLMPFLDPLREAIAFPKNAGELRRDEEARDIWKAEYPALSEGKPGLAGAMLARGEAQTMRLACLYALLDLSPVVRAEHLRAALSLWRYCERSVRFIFGDSLGDSVADEILAVLRQRPEGMTRNEIRDLFGGHKSSERLGRSLAVLLRFGLAEYKPEDTGGRPAERWFYSNAKARKAP